jgi:hypothetical protein
MSSGNNDDLQEKALVIETDIPDIAAVQNLWLYITVEGLFFFF